ncbi:MAG: hypothetical protein CL878_05935 [Dehalococcoidia bacterium]|nr:hypothetical protein [Dehalococcoidia bacterium]
MAGRKPLAVEFLFFADCPSHDTALERLREALRLEEVPASLTVREMRTEEEARAAQFPGSPTIRINGDDIQPRGAVGPYGLMCRMYFHEGGRITPLPTLAQIREVIHLHVTAQEQPAAAG